MMDRSLYPVDWPTLSYNIRFIVAGGRCQRCGALHGSSHPITGAMVILATAHLDQNPKNNHFSNLAALCARCHFLHDLYYNIMKRKYGKHYKLYQLEIWPYDPVAGLPLFDCN